MLPNSNDPTIRIVVVDDDFSYQERLRSTLEGHHRIRIVGMSNTGKDGISQARDGAPDAIVIDHSLTDMSGLDVAEQVAKVSPGTVVLIATDVGSLDLYNRAMAIGVKQVFTKQMTGKDIAGVIEAEVDAFRENLRKQAENLPLVAPGTGPKGLRGEGNQNVINKLQTYKKVVIAVTSGIKGGVGKTTTSVNLACAAATQADVGVKVALCDFNEAGNVTVQLNMGTPKNLSSRSVLNWNYISNNPTVEELEEFMLRHESGIWVLPSVPTPERIVELNEALVKKVVNGLRQHFDLVICDLPPSITFDASWATIELADYVLVVVCPDDQEISGIEQFNDTVSKLACHNKCYRIINKYNEPESLTIADLNKYQPYPVIGKLPYDPKVRKGRKTGQPLVLTDPVCEYSEGIRDSLNKMIPVFVTSSGNSSGKNSGGLFKSIFGKFRSKSAI